MLKRSSDGGNQSHAAASRRSSQPSGLPFMKAEHLSTEYRELSILMARAETDKWDNASVMMKVRYDGKLFLWQPNEKNPNYDALIEILGEDEKLWAGNVVLIGLEKDEMTERYHIRVRECETNAAPAPEPPKATKKAGR